MYRQVIKPLLDVLTATLMFLILSPVFLLVMVFLTLSLGGNPFFFQRRPGKNERIFTILKFRTMNNERDEQGELLPDELRLTRVGRFIRTTSLDEIPQLLNVMIGNMSLVGPRPLLPEYLTLYSEEQKKRHSVKPGITGWAQVNGRNALTWKDKLALDVWYANHISFVLDIQILLKTVIKVFKREGITAEGQSTTSRFKGN
ncbi:lipid carrier--UDP-N-acetylgalactosaminyltransferase [Pukyongia salina]|uniref:Lipid carrier--UDP-N-acetylgalactosaminyltransferase n=1 Tax=Pukyongia salina TaxID=2094025 RepID=A0A2S0HZ06_9FLAO|nr:sugar transferase [Pukyongia salina]AVI51804.1 lipid carrier--UDP-N-acetylgalactosaminyltransferase [Pukyongia salina]